MRISYGWDTEKKYFFLLCPIAIQLFHTFILSVYFLSFKTSLSFKSVVKKGK